MAYNITGIKAATTLLPLFQVANDEGTGGLLFYGFLLAIFFVMLMTLLRKNDFPDALLSSSFVCFFLGGLLAYAKLINILFPLGFLVLTAFTGLYVYTVKH